MKHGGFYKRNVNKEQLKIKLTREQCKQNFLTEEDVSSCGYIKKNGLSSSGKQKYYCKACGATISVGEGSNRMSYKEIKQIFILKQRENLSLRKIAKRLGYSHSTIIEN